MSVVRNSGYNIAGSLVGLLASLLSVPLYLHLIGVDRFGILSLCWLLFGYFGIFEFGLGPAVGQRIASQHAFGPPAWSAVIRTGLLYGGLLGCLGAIILFFVGRAVLLNTHDLAPWLAAEAREGMIWLALSLPLTTVTAVLSGALIGRKQFLAANVLGVVINLATTLFPLVAALLGFTDLPALLLAVLAARGVTTLMFAAYVTRYLPIVRPIAAEVSGQPGLLQFGGWVAFGGLVSQLLVSLDKVVVAWRLGPSTTSFYMIGYNLANRYLMLPASINSALTPEFAGLGEKDRQRLEINAQRLLTGLTAPLMVAAIAALPWFLDLWIGTRIAAEVRQPAIILLVGVWLNGCSFISHARLQSEGQADRIAIIRLVQVPFYLGALILAVMTANLLVVAAVFAVRAFLELLIYFRTTGNIGRLFDASKSSIAIVLVSLALSLILDERHLGTLFATQVVAFLISARFALGILDSSELYGILPGRFIALLRRIPLSPLRRASNGEDAG